MRITVTPLSASPASHGALDRRRTAPAWQQRGVAVDAAQARNIQHHLRQDQAVGDHHQQVGLERGQFGLGVGVAQGRRLQHRDVVFQRPAA